MNVMKLVGTGLLAISPMTAMATGMGNSIDGYYVSSGLEVDVENVGSGDDDGDGFGVKGTFAFADQLFFNGEYQTVGYDDSDADLDQIRAGVGINTSASEQIVFYGLAEFISFDFDNEDDSGFGVHGGAIFNLNQAIALNARLGYVDLGDSDGLEWLAGGSFKFTPQVAAFIDYRVTNQEDSGVELDVDDLRIGARFIF